MILLAGVKILVKGTKVINDAGKGIEDIQKFIPDGSVNHTSADVIKNATANNKLINNIDNEKLLTKNVAGNGEQSIVAVEKNSTGSTVFSAKETELVDHRTGTAYTYDDILESAKDVDKPKTVITVSGGKDQITTSAGQKGGWNKELNKPQENKVYKVDNTNAGKPHTYTTGVGGRIEKVEAELKLTPRDRNGYQQSVKCNNAKGGTPGTDQGGHLIGSRFDGAGEQINLVPMNGTLNTGAWKTMENEWAGYLQQVPLKNVRVEIRPIYDGSSLKPVAFEVDSWIDSVKGPLKTFGN